MHGLLSIFFAQTRLIWNILTTCSKYWHMGYNSHSIFITKHKFSMKIEKSTCTKNFEIPFISRNSTSRWFLNLIIFCNFDRKFVFSAESWVGIIPHMSIFGSCSQNIPNQTSLGKKIDNNPCTFLVSKVAFYGAYDQYKLCFEITFY